MQVSRLVNWYRFRHRYEQHMGLSWVTESIGPVHDAHGHLTTLAIQFPVLRAGGVKRQKRVTGGSGVQDDKAFLCLFDRAGECL